MVRTHAQHLATPLIPAHTKQTLFIFPSCPDSKAIQRIHWMQLKTHETHETQEAGQTTKS